MMLHKDPILVSLLFLILLSYFSSVIKYSICLTFDDESTFVISVVCRVMTEVPYSRKLILYLDVHC